MFVLRPRASCILAIISLVGGLPASSLAQSAAGSASATQTELAALREEVRQLRAEVDRLVKTASIPKEAGTSVPATAPAPVETPAQSALADAVAMLQAQMGEQAQTKVESASRLPVKLTGTILLNAAFNSGEANWLENPNLTALATPSPTGSHSASLRQSRIGLAVDGPTLGRWRASSVLAFDFFGGTPAFQTGPVMGLPRLLYGFVRLEGERTSFEVGQDEAILAPRNPTSLAAQSFPALFRSGNLYFRVPQARVEQRLGRGTTLAAGVVSPIAGDYDGAYTFAPPALAGERSRTPAVQARLGYTSPDESSEPQVSVGVSGHYGRRRRPAGSDESWAAALDFDARIGRLGFAGELFSGRNLAAYGGGAGQEGRARGGFAETRVHWHDRLDSTVGIGIDRRSLSAVAPSTLREQRTVFGNVIVRLTPEVSTSVEYRWLSALFQSASSRRQNHHVNLVFAFTF